MSEIQNADTALRLAIVRRAFTVRRRGYDTAEVDELLAVVSNLADDLLTGVDALSRHLAEAEAELIGARAEVRELRETTAATEQLLASARAELRAACPPPEHDHAVDEKLVVAEAELRLVRASAEHTQRLLDEALGALDQEQATRSATEAALADVSQQLDEDQAARGGDGPPDTGRDPFAAIGDEVAALLRAAAEAAEGVRRQAAAEAEAVLAEARALADALLDDAEATVAGTDPLPAPEPAADGADRACPGPEAAADPGWPDGWGDLAPAGTGSPGADRIGRPFSMECNGGDGID